MIAPRLGPGTRTDLPRIHQVRHGTAENRLTNPALVTDTGLAWYPDEAIFLVSGDEAGVHGFIRANHRTGHAWALFVIDVLSRCSDLRRFRLRSSRSSLVLPSRFTRPWIASRFQSGAICSKAERFHQSRGWRATGVNVNGETAFRRWL